MKRILGLMLLSIILLPMATAQIIPSSESIEIHRAEEVEVGFSIVNSYNTTLFFTINVPYVSGWGINVTQQSGIIAPQQAIYIRIVIKAPDSYGNTQFDLNFEVNTYTTTGQMSSYVYKLHVIFLSPSKFLFFFEIPWPESWGYWGDFLNEVLTWAIITGILYLLFPLFKRVVKLTKTEIDDILLDIFHKPVVIWVITYGLTSAFLTLPFLSSYYGIIFQIYEIIVIIIVTWVVYRIFRELVIRYLFHLSRGKKGDLENVLIPILEKLGIVTIGFIGFAMILQVLGVNVSLLLASMGVIGIILGFAAQETLGNFFSGIHILADKAFRIGDIIMLENDEGVYRVLDVGVRSTRLYELFTNTVVFVPNSKLASQNIINFNRPDSRMKIRVDVSVSYGSDVKKVIETLKDIAYSHPHILKGGEYDPVVIFREFGNSSLNFSLYVWVEDIMDQWNVGSELREEIVNRFRERGIEIPYPQVDVHIKPVKSAR